MCTSSICASIFQESQEQKLSLVTKFFNSDWSRKDNFDVPLGHYNTRRFYLYEFIIVTIRLLRKLLLGVENLRNSKQELLSSLTVINWEFISEDKFERKWWRAEEGNGEFRISWPLFTNFLNPRLKICRSSGLFKLFAPFFLLPIRPFSTTHPTEEELSFYNDPCREIVSIFLKRSASQRRIGPQRIVRSFKTSTPYNRLQTRTITKRKSRTKSKEKRHNGWNARRALSASRTQGASIHSAGRVPTM